MTNCQKDREVYRNQTYNLWSFILRNIDKFRARNINLNENLLVQYSKFLKRCPWKSYTFWEEFYKSDLNDFDKFWINKPDYENLDEIADVRNSSSQLFTALQARIEAIDAEKSNSQKSKRGKSENRALSSKPVEVTLNTTNLHNLNKQVSAPASPSVSPTSINLSDKITADVAKELGYWNFWEYAFLLM